MRSRGEWRSRINNIIDDVKRYDGSGGVGIIGAEFKNGCMVWMAREKLYWIYIYMVLKNENGSKTNRMPPWTSTLARKGKTEALDWGLSFVLLGV